MPIPMRNLRNPGTLLEATSAGNVVRIEGGTGWQVTAVPARLELTYAGGPLPVGWVLIRAVLHRRGSDFSARLYADTGVPEAEMLAFDIPVTRKGTVLELVRLPEGVRRLLLQPMNSVGDFELAACSIAPVGHVERVARKFQRVMPMYFKQPRERRHKLGLRAYTPLLDLQKAYRLAGRMRAYSPSLTYREWIEQFDSLTNHDRRLIRRDFRRWRRAPHFDVIVFDGAGGDPSCLQITLKSLEQQLYRDFTVTVIPAEGAHPVWPPLVHSRWQSNIEPAWVVVLQSGMTLSEHALYWLASEAMQHPATSLLYCDHDYLSDAGERSDPAFKPDWSPELLRSTNYIGRAAAIRSDMLMNTGGLSLADVTDADNHDLLLRVTERLAPSEIRHVPAALWHLPISNGEQASLGGSRESTPVESHLKRLGVMADVVQTATGSFRVKYALPVLRPKVSIVVPTRDALSHLSACIESVLSRSTYEAVELIVVDNQSSDPQTLAYLDALRKKKGLRVLRYDQPFNYSAINNFAAREATGEVLCLLNNDTEVITPEWMEEMLGHLVQPGVGVVGAKLYFSDGRVQHAGDTVGPGGCAHHLHAFIGRNDPGYCDRAILAQDLSAVTAACLMTWRKLFLDLGGLDERNLSVAFNDVDYCLRVRETGHRVVWTPHAELYHHESVSRGKDDSPEKAARMTREVTYMRKRWRHVMRHDPFYNPNLNYTWPDFSLSNAPMVKRPWRD